MTATTTPPADLRGDVLHCPTCGRELNIYEETRCIDRITYTRPRYDHTTAEWTYSADGDPRNQSVELIDRYLQCRCGYTAPAEDRYDDLPNG